MSESADNEAAEVVPLPVRFKRRDGEDAPSLRLIRRYGFRDECDHRNTTYIVCEGESQVECGRCGTKLEAIWVLTQFAHSEMRWYRSRERYQDEMKRLSARSRTKCEHCGRMTRISR